MTEALAVPYVAATPEAGEEATVDSRRVGGLFLAVGLALFALMGVLGLAMRFAQADAYHLSPVWFYRIMTLHGAGMLVAAMLCQIGALWYLLRADVGLHARRAAAVLVLMAGGAVLVLAAVLAGGFAAGWTFLYPLPFSPAGQWGSNATTAFLVGLALVGVGFQLFCLDVLLQTTARYGGLARTLGIEYLRDRDPDPPPPQVLAAAVVSIDGLITAAIGTLTVVALYGRVLDDKVAVDPLWAKNVTFFFGHSFANLIIYLAVGAIYVLLPRYAGRPWKTTKPIVYAWLATLVFVVIAYSHHLYMDFVQPRGFEFISAFASSAAAVPVLVVTVYTAVMLIWGSRYRWTLASTLLYLGLPGWLIGGAGAVIDSMIPMNFRLHNTLWVPAHFHTYLLLAVMLWAMAHAVHLLERSAQRPARRALAVAAPLLMVVGGYGLVGTWFVSGALGIPRRYAVEPFDTAGYSMVGAVFASVFAAGFLVLLVAFADLARARGAGAAAAPAAPVGYRPAMLDPPGQLPVQSGWRLSLLGALTTVTLVALTPAGTRVAEHSVRWHHVAHTAMFLAGATAVMTAVAATGRGQDWLSVDGALAVAIAAPVVFMVAMTPRFYSSLEEDALLHAAYHAAFFVLPGALMGAASVRLGRSVGWVALLTSAGAGLLYAAGVSGG